MSTKKSKTAKTKAPRKAKTVKPAPTLSETDAALFEVNGKPAARVAAAAITAADVALFASLSSTLGGLRDGTGHPLVNMAPVATLHAKLVALLG